MKTITRGHAIEMFRQLGTMALGHLDTETLTATLDNFDKFRKIHEDYQALAQELSKRLYEGKDEEQRNNFFEVVAHYEHAHDPEQKAQHEAVMKNAFEDFYVIYKKQIAVLTKMYNKEIEMEIAEVDRDAFVKGVILGKKDVPAAEIEIFFSPMFKEEKHEADMSELDELLKD